MVGAKKISVRLVFLAAVAMGVSAASFADPQTLQGIVQQTVLGNPEVLARWHSYQAAESEHDAALGGFLPRLDLTAGKQRGGRDDPVLNNSNYTSSTRTLTLSQMLYDGFATLYESRRLDHARMARLFELHDVSQGSALDAVQAYYDVLRYRKLVSLAEENYVQHKALFEQIQLKVQSGVGRRVDLEQASGRLALAEANLLTETANLHDVSARFQRLVGVPPGKEMEDAGPMKKGIPDGAGEAQKTALENNPSIRAAVENVRSADAMRNERTAAYQPRLDLRLQKERGSDIDGYTGPTDNHSAEVVLSWNLFNGFSDRNRHKQYAEQANAARDLRDKACRDVRQTTSIAYNDVRKLTQQLVYLDQHQLSTEKARDAYRKQFDIGQRTLLDLLDTENELFEARRAYTNAENDLNIAYARVHAGTGDLLEALGVSRLDVKAAKNLDGWNTGEDMAQQCPPDEVGMFVSDKAALDARAMELMKAEALAAQQDPQVLMAGNPDIGAVGQAIKDWTEAWSSKDVDKYLDAYAKTFAPPGGVSMKNWAARRRASIVRAKTIKVSIADIRIETSKGVHAIARFTQTINMDGQQRQSGKILELEKMQGQWKITRETEVPTTKPPVPNQPASSAAAR